MHVYVGIKGITRRVLNTNIDVDDYLYLQPFARGKRGGSPFKLMDDVTSCFVFV